MLGLMQDWNLTAPKVLEHAASSFADIEIVTRGVEGGIRRSNYANCAKRARQVSAGLRDMKIGLGDRVATMAWNTDRHLEAWYGIMGIGAICHTVNPRLFPEQIIYIINHAQDRLVILDTTFIPIFQAIADKLESVEGYVILTDQENMPETGLKNAICYEDWIAQHESGAEQVVWGDFDENTAAGLCYTSGTTGNPKGVLYSHRSNILHALVVGLPDCMGISMRSTIMPVVPMFHANAWAIAFTAPLVGAKLVMPGADMTGEGIYELLETEQVDFSAAVPTVWQGLLQYLDQVGKRLTYMKGCIIGGAAVPRSLFEQFKDKHGVTVIQGWGMTEMSPLGTVGRLTLQTDSMSDEEKLQMQIKQGRAPFSVEMKIVDDEGKEQPHDGKSYGRLLVRGPAVAKAYFRHDEEILDADGWFDTGDVAHIDPMGFMQITDRAKDVIKSGGEWISSIDLENESVGHPKAAVAAVIGLPHPKWDERPLLIVQLKEGETATKEEFIEFLPGKVAKWWLPDDVVFVDSIPLTATGKIQKLELRETFKDYKLPGT